MASALLAIILLGAQSAVVIASRAIPSGKQGASAVVTAGVTLGSMADDVSVATAFSTLGPADIQFTVPDRNGDAVDDVIRYVWAGTVGNPLQRQVNGGALTTVAENVQSFALTYDKVQVALPTTYTEGAEQTLYSHVSGSGLQVGQVKSAKWWAQYVQPTIPANAAWWRVTHVSFGAQKKSGSTGIAKAQLQRSISTTPMANVLAETTVLESGLNSSMSAEDVSFSNVTGLRPGDALCFVFQWVADVEAFEIQYHTATGVGASSPLMTSANNGSSWSVVANSELVFAVYGKVAMPDAVQYEYQLRNVGCRLRCGSNAAITMSATWAVFNQPAVPGP